MAKSDAIIKIRIDVTKINKEWLYKGEKGTYLDATVFYNEKQDKYESNGMIVQDVPTNIYKEDKDKPDSEKRRGEILGNCKNWATRAGNHLESVPGGGAKEEKKKDEVDDDLPF